MKKFGSKWLIILVVVVLFFVFVVRTSGYTLSPGAIMTDIKDSTASLFDLKTDLSCVPGNTMAGGKSTEDYYTKGDGTGYGICGGEKLVKDQMAYKIMGSEAALGD
jgi:hypothetical protein